MGERAPTAAGFHRALDRVLFATIPLGLVVLLATKSTRHYFWDFRVFWHAGKDVLAGHSPYPPPDPSLLAHQSSFVYPPETALAFAPLSLLPYQLAAGLFFALLVACLLSTLWVLEVRDWRCYGAAVLFAPVVSAITNGTLSCVLALGVALAWRYRDSWPRVAAAVAGVVVLKVFLWPLALWLVATRRFAAAAAAAIGGALVTFVSWAVLGFAGLSDYPHLLRLLADAEQAEGYSPIALGLSLGLPASTARAVTLALGALVLAGMFLVARRREGDRDALTLAIAASLLLSPIVWLHYFVLLLVPLALARSRLSPAWVLLPLPFWFSSTNGQSHGHAASIALALAAACALLLVSMSGGWRLRRPSARRAAAPAPAAR